MTKKQITKEIQGGNMSSRTNGNDNKGNQNIIQNVSKPDYTVPGRGSNDTNKKSK